MKKIIIVISLLICWSKIHAQDFTFSQFYDVPLYRNPALAGIFNGNLRLTSAYRSQWGSVTVPFETKTVSAEVTFPMGFNEADMMTVGLQLANDVAGDSKLGRTQFMPVVSFHKAFYDEVSYLTFALMGGLVQSQFDPTKLNFGGQYDANTGDFSLPGPIISNSTTHYFDGSTGLAFNSELWDGSRYYIGLAAYHFLKPKINFFSDTSVILKPRYSVNGGINFVSGDRNHTYLYVDGMLQGGHRQLLLGMLHSHVIKNYLEYEDNIALAFGASYRWGDAIVPTIKLEMRHFFIGTSYDINISKLTRASMYRGGFEFTMSYVAALNSLLSNKEVERAGCPVRF